jgi:dTDP-glucose 4,6-dehydratase
VDHCAAIDSVLHHGRDGEIYNLGAGNEWTNREIAGRILQLLGKPESLLAHVQDRPGHDRRYALDRAKAQKQLGWVPRTMLEDGLKQTVAWYLANREWMRRVSARKFKSYCRQQYDERETMLAGIRDTNGRA